MSLSIKPELINQIKQDEGLRLRAYQDTLGNWTIGYGHTPALEGEIWTPAQAEETLVLDLNKAANELDKALPWAEGMGVVRWSVFVNMTFNLGIGGLLKFRDTLSAAQSGDYEKAAAGMLNSLWAKQVGQRAFRLADQMRTDIWANSP